MNKTKKIRSIVAVALAFILSVCIFAVSLLTVVRFTALSPSYAKSVISKCGFGEKKLDELKTELVSYGNACNIGSDFFDKFFETTLTAEFVEKDASDYYSVLFADTKAKPNSERLEQALKPALLEYAAELGYEDENLDEDLNVIVGEMGEIYTGILSLPSTSTVSSMIIRLTKYCNLALLGALGLGAFAALMLVFMFKPKTHSVRHLIYAFSGAFLMLLVLPLYTRLSNLVGKVNIVSKALYSFIVTFGNGILNAVLISSGVCLIITILLWAVYIRLSKTEE